MIADTENLNIHGDDEIVSIEYVGIMDTIDINTSGNRLFYANDILTHNSAVEEIEFDHSHIAGGISKINTADYVFGIFTSRSMRERGKYQIQCMKSRSSTGVGQKIDLEYDIDTMRITDDDPEEGRSHTQAPTQLMSQLKTTSSVSETVDNLPTTEAKVATDVQGAKLKTLLNSLKKN
jgi:hypothetical protein